MVIRQVGILKEINGIDRFLELSPLNSPYIDYTKDANQERIDDFIAHNKGKKLKRQQDPQSLFWVNHFSDGRVGKFKEQLTAKELADVEAIAMPWLKDRNYI